MTTRATIKNDPPNASKCLEAALSSIPETDQFVAVGIDLAASDAKWGITVISLDADFETGTIRCMLPFKHDVKWIRPTGDAVFTLLDKLKKTIWTMD